MGVILVTNQRQAKRLVRNNYVLYCRCSLGDRVAVTAYQFDGPTIQVKTSHATSWLTPDALWAELATQLCLWDATPKENT